MNSMAITQLDGSPGTLAISDIDEFAKRLRGRLVRRGDADYAAARAVWNGMIEKHVFMGKIVDESRQIGNGATVHREWRAWRRRILRRGGGNRNR